MPEPAEKPSLHACSPLPLAHITTQTDKKESRLMHARIAGDRLALLTTEQTQPVVTSNWLYRWSELTVHLSSAHAYPWTICRQQNAHNNVCEIQDDSTVCVWLTRKESLA